MDHIIIYGLLDQSREIFWISDYWFEEGLTALDDAFWKWMMARNNDCIKKMEWLSEEKDLVVLEEVPREKWSINRLMKWIDIFKVYNYTLYSHEEVMNFKNRQEKEWEWENRMMFGKEEKDG